MMIDILHVPGSLFVVFLLDVAIPRMTFRHSWAKFHLYLIGYKQYVVVVANQCKKQVGAFFPIQRQNYLNRKSDCSDLRLVKNTKKFDVSTLSINKCQYQELFCTVNWCIKNSNQVFVSDLRIGKSS